MTTPRGVSEVFVFHTGIEWMAFHPEKKAIMKGMRHFKGIIMGLQSGADVKGVNIAIKGELRLLQSTQACY